jgi:hypothetical protein
MWIAWEKHRRTIELCKYIGITPNILESNFNRAIKHPVYILKTILLINKNKPKILFVQNPSIILAFLACLLRNIYSYKLIVDAHNASIIPEGLILSKFYFLYNYVQKEADMTILTNNKLAEIVNNNGGNPFVLQDKIPEPSNLKIKELKGKYNLIYICTFEKDEPYEEVILAAKKLSSDIIIYITGNFRKCNFQIVKLAPENIIFTGFLSDKDYWDILYSADFILDLTKRDNCLVCGAYESVSVERPMILSDTEALRSYFSKGAIFTDNSAESICSSITYGISKQNELKREIKEIKNQLLSNWNQKGGELLEIVKRFSSNCL